MQIRLNGALREAVPHVGSDTYTLTDTGEVVLVGKNHGNDDHYVIEVIQAIAVVEPPKAKKSKDTGFVDLIEVDK